MSTPPLRMEVKKDCDLVSATEVSKRLIEIVLTTPEVSQTKERLNLSLALILDHSGSMAGEKLEFVKQAACHVLDCLSEHDRVAVIAFDNEVQVVASSSPVTPQFRTQVKDRIQALRVGNNTALFDGWLHGVNEVASHMLTRGVNRVLLLTDGRANYGETRQEVIEHHIREVRLRNISTSTFGVGADFNQYLLEGMAAQGGGHYHFIEAPNQIPSLFQRELGELMAIVARQTSVKVTSPLGGALKLLGDLPHEAAGRSITIPLGELFGGSQRVLILEAFTPTDKSGPIRFTVELSWQDEQEENRQIKQDVLFIYAGEAETKAAARDWDLRRRAATLRMSTAEARALHMANEGKYQEAAEYLLEKVNHYETMLEPDYVATLRELIALFTHRKLDNMEAKRRHDINYKKRFSRL